MIAIVLSLLAVVANGDDKCRFFVQDAKSPIPNRWYGALTLSSPYTLNGVWLKLEFDRRVLHLGSWFGEVEPKNNDNLEFLIKDHRRNLQADATETVRFYVQHNRRDPAPRLVSARLNGRRLCPDIQKSSPSSVAEIEDDLEQCGTVVVRAAPLITHGLEVNEGAYPWHVAIYHRKSSYACGGSLISKRYVLTAGHCVFQKHKKIVSTQEITVQLGKHYLKQESVQERSVAQIILHPSYNSTNYKNDITLLKLATPADIDDFVRTVCLWQNHSMTTDEGVVVGWGFDETGKLSQELMQTKMPVVSQESCIFSNPDFYSRFTSENTYCAGHRNGTSVCNGDSGGGMVFSSNQKWYLRGIVSLAVPLPDYTCDSFNYVIFTDVAKYVDWIKASLVK